MSPYFYTLCSESYVAPSHNSNDTVRGITIRKLSAEFYAVSAKELEANGINGHATIVNIQGQGLQGQERKPSRTGWQRYLGIIFTFSASLNFSLAVLFAKLLQEYDYHGNGASFWRYIGVVVPGIPLILYYELGYRCSNNRHLGLSALAAGKGSVATIPISASPSTVSIISKESIKDPEEQKQEATTTTMTKAGRVRVSPFNTIWPLTDAEKRRTAFFVFLRGLLAAISVILRYYALEYLPIGDTAVISYSTPVLIVILAHFMLGERAGFISFFIAFTTLIGVVIVAKPPILTGASSFTTESLIGTGLAVASLLSSSLQIILTRVVRQVHFAVMTLGTGVVGLVISIGLMLYFQDFVYPTSWTDGGYVAGLTGTCFLGQMSIILALKFEQAGPVSLIRTSDVVIGFVLQYVFMQVVPTWTSVVGGVIVVSGVLVTGARKWVQELSDDDPRKHKWFNRVLLF